MATKKPSKRTKKTAPVSTLAPKDVVQDLVDLKSEIEAVEQEIVVAVKPVAKRVIPVLSSVKAIFLAIVSAIVARDKPLKVRVALAIVAAWIAVMVMFGIVTLACVGPVGWTVVGVMTVFVWAALNVEE